MFFHEYQAPPIRDLCFSGVPSRPSGLGDLTEDVRAFGWIRSHLWFLICMYMLYIYNIQYEVCMFRPYTPKYINAVCTQNYNIYIEESRPVRESRDETAGLPASHPITSPHHRPLLAQQMSVWLLWIVRSGYSAFFGQQWDVWTTTKNRDVS